MLGETEPDIKEVKAERRVAHRTQWAAQFAVANELCKKGFEVAFTTGNHPSVDLMARTPKRVSFSVDIEGLYRKSSWVVKAKPICEDVFYVLAYVPDGDRNRFFVLNQMQVNTEVAAEVERARLRAQSKGRTEEKAGLFPGVDWKFAEQYEDAWKALPGEHDGGSFHGSRPSPERRSVPGHYGVRRGRRVHGNPRASSLKVGVSVGVRLRPTPDCLVKTAR